MEHHDSNTKDRPDPIVTSAALEVAKLAIQRLRLTAEEPEEANAPQLKHDELTAQIRHRLEQFRAEAKDAPQFGGLCQLPDEALFKKMLEIAKSA